MELDGTSAFSAFSWAEMTQTETAKTETETGGNRGTKCECHFHFQSPTNHTIAGFYDAPDEKMSFKEGSRVIEGVLSGDYSDANCGGRTFLLC